MEEDNTVQNFIAQFKELKNSSNDLLFNKSFNINIVEENIELVKQKRYVISDEIWNIEEKNNHKFLSLLLELIGQHADEYAENIEKISSIFNKDVTFSKEFTLDVLYNKQKKISDFARSKSLSIDFLTFFSIFSAFPYRNSVAQFVQSKENLADHISSYCPVCGHWPGMSYIIEKDGRKFMACICCGTVWSFNRLKCSFCFSTDKDALGYLNIEGKDEISAYTCDSCRRYLKTRSISKDNTEISEDMILSDYMNSSHVDIAALQNKYLQEWIIGTRFDGPRDERIDDYLKMKNS